MGEKGLTRSEYRVKYQIQDSSFNYQLQAGRIGVFHVPESKELASRVRGVTYVDKSPLTNEEIIASPKYSKDGLLLDNSKLISLHELADILGVGRLSKLSSMLHAFSQEEGIDLIHFSCFEGSQQTVWLVGILRDYEDAFKKWYHEHTEPKNQSRKSRASGIVAYQEVSFEILTSLYPYNVVADLFKESQDDLYRVNPLKLKSYISDKFTKQQREDTSAIYFKGIPVIQWAKKQDITKAAMYLRLERNREQLLADKDQFMFKED